MIFSILVFRNVDECVRVCGWIGLLFYLNFTIVYLFTSGVVVAVVCLAFVIWG